MSPFTANPKLSVNRRIYNTDAAYLLRIEKLPEQQLLDRLTVPSVHARLREIVQTWGHYRLAERAREILAKLPKGHVPSEQAIVGSTVLVDFTLPYGENIKVPCEVHDTKRTGVKGIVIMYEVSPLGGKGKAWIRAERASGIRKGDR